MLTAILVIGAVAVPADTVFTMGTTRRDLTGDGQPEILRLVARGPSLDSLAVTFTIESSGQILFQAALMPLTRTQGFDGRRRPLTREEHRTRLDEFPRWFFDEGKFKQPAGFVDAWGNQSSRHVARIPEVIGRDRRRQFMRDSLLDAGVSRREAESRAAAYPRATTAQDQQRAMEIWQEIQRSGVTIFEFSPGGDGIYAIAWNTRDQRFYRLIECC